MPATALEPRCPPPPTYHDQPPTPAQPPTDGANPDAVSADPLPSGTSRSSLPRPPPSPSRPASAPIRPAPAKAGPTPSAPRSRPGYGLRFLRATLAVQGGLVDVRFVILDTIRAEPVIGHLSRERVKLVDDATGRVLDTRTMTPGDSNLKAGEGYYMLFRNSGGLLHPGSHVSVAIGKLRLPGVTVR